MATGRRPATLALNLHYAGVNIDDSGKVFASKPGKWHESTDNERVFAIGDCMRGNPELTPVSVERWEIMRNLSRLTRAHWDIPHPSGCAYRWRPIVAACH